MKHASLLQEVPRAGIVSRVGLQLTLFHKSRHLPGLLAASDVPGKPLPQTSGNQKYNQSKQRKPLGSAGTTATGLPSCERLRRRPLPQHLPLGCSIVTARRNSGMASIGDRFDQHRENMAGRALPLLLGKFELSERVATLVKPIPG